MATSPAGLSHAEGGGGGGEGGRQQVVHQPVRSQTEVRPTHPPWLFEPVAQASSPPASTVAQSAAEVRPQPLLPRAAPYTQRTHRAPRRGNAKDAGRPGRGRPVWPARRCRCRRAALVPAAAPRGESESVRQAPQRPAAAGAGGRSRLLLGLFCPCTACSAPLAHCAQLSSLVFLEHKNGSITQGSLSAVTAAASIPGAHVSALVAGDSVDKAAQAAARIEGVSKASAAAEHGALRAVRRAVPLGIGLGTPFASTRQWRATRWTRPKRPPPTRPPGQRASRR
jgi:hypothetical protein